VDPVWANLVTGRKHIPFEHVAAKMLILRLRLGLRTDPSPANVSRCAGELHALYAANLSLCGVQDDIAKIEATR
jgi:hypothetical protein